MSNTNTNNIEENNTFLGRGWKFPVSFAEGSYTVKLVEEEEDIKESLIILLNTALGERIMNPEYGSSLDDLLFERIDITTLTMISNRLKRAIMYHESRVEIISIDLTPDMVNGIIQVFMNYKVTATNTRYNFVYPYYLNEGTDI